MTTEELLKKAEEAIKLLKESKLSNYVISKQTHISQSTLGNYKNGKTKPTPANTEILLQFFSSENVLAGGLGCWFSFPIFVITQCTL